MSKHTGCTSTTKRVDKSVSSNTWESKKNLSIKQFLMRLLNKSLNSKREYNYKKWEKLLVDKLIKM